MKSTEIEKMFDLTGKVAVVTGGGGILCSAIATGLAKMGVSVAVLDISEPAATKVASEINSFGGKSIGLTCNVLNKESIQHAAVEVEKTFGRVDFLINGAGGNKTKATTSAELSFFDLPAEAINDVFGLNFLGTLLPSQVFGKLMAVQKEGAIINVSSMNSFKPLTRIPAYSAAKAAVSNFTQWLAVHMAQEYSPKIRVNAIAPGFFLTEQNRFLMKVAETEELTERGKKILAHIPMGRFGSPEDLLSTVIWLLAPSSMFITGIIVPVDGGFSSFSGI
jgi:NAD(P)-dependent dehydrogenase (short-subunit alcohol dehydrogenase family)